MSEERFWNNVDKTETKSKCWEWKLSCRADGYGQVRFEGKMLGAHRIAFELFHKRLITEGLCILHLCDNIKCCRPSHLSEGTHQENMIDRNSKNRQARQKGETCGTSKLNEVQVLEIRKNYAEGTYTHRALGTEYNICHSTISDIINRNTWAHI